MRSAPTILSISSRGSWQHAKLLHGATLGRVAHLLPPHEPAPLAPQCPLTRRDRPCNAGPEQFIHGGAICAGDAHICTRLPQGELAALLGEQSGPPACRPSAPHSGALPLRPDMIWGPDLTSVRA